LFLFLCFMFYVFMFLIIKSVCKMFYFIKDALLNFII